MAGIGVPERFGDDDGVAYLVHRAVESLEPDPLFRRRLRGTLLNSHVALRAGQHAAGTSRRMGTIGRAALLASLMLAISVSAAGAAAQFALPGELLYPVKRQLETIRLELASGAAHDDLLAAALDERVAELEQLVTGGEWDLAVVAGDDVNAAERTLLATGRSLGTAQEAQLNKRVARLEALIATAPAAARGGLQRALRAASEHAGGMPARSPSGTTPSGATPSGAAPANGEPAGTSRGSQASHAVPAGQASQHPAQGGHDPHQSEGGNANGEGHRPSG